MNQSRHHRRTAAPDGRCAAVPAATTAPMAEGPAGTGGAP